MRASLRPPSVAAVVGGAAALWGLAIGLTPLDDNSALTHLATGRLILADGIPRHDPFSFTAAGQPWTVYSWLASAGMALADRVGGAHGIQMARAVLTTCLALIAWRLTRPAEALGGRVIAVAVVLAIGTGAWPERPLLVALVLFAILVLLVETERGSPWLLVPLMWVWVNVHGTFPFALIYLAVRLLGRRFDGASVDRFRRVAAAAAVGTLVGAVNPLGPRLLVFPFELLARRDLLERVREWRPVDLSRPPQLAFFLAVLIAVLLAGRRRSWEDSGVAVVFGVVGCLAQRNVALASLALTPPLARGLRGLGTVTGEERGRPAAAALAALVVAAVGLTWSSLAAPAYNLDRYPVRQLRWMEAQGLLEKRVATQDFVGNLMVARGGREANVFFDDRYDLYPRRVITDSLALLDGTEGWQRRLDRYGIEVVLWQRSKPLAALLALDPAWEVIRRDDDWVVARRSK